jgi:hypothetical protein
LKQTVTVLVALKTGDIDGTAMNAERLIAPAERF